MHTPVISNNILFKKWCDKENEYMSRRLSAIEPKINIKCPESFEFSKTKFKQSSNNYNLVKEHERKTQNQYLFKKLTNIYINPSNRLFGNNNNNKSVPTLSNNINGCAGIDQNTNIRVNNSHKWSLLKIAQDNQLMYRRLVETKSAYYSLYDQNKTKEDFFQNTYLKKRKKVNKKNNHSDNTTKSDIKARTNEDFFKLKRREENRSRRGTEIEIDYKQKNNTETNFNKTKDKIKSDLDLPLGSENNYKRQAFVQQLGLANISIISNYDKLVIIIDPISMFVNKLMIIAFENVENIKLLKVYYKNYEQILNDLEFDGQNIIINNAKAELIYRTKVISKDKYHSQDIYK